MREIDRDRERKKLAEEEAGKLSEEELKKKQEEEEKQRIIDDMQDNAGDLEIINAPLEENEGGAAWADGAEDEEKEGVGAQSD